MGRYVLLFSLVIFSYVSNAQDKHHSFEIRTGLEGQFYFKNMYNPVGYLQQEGGEGRAATVGGGIPINYIHHFNKYSISISPAVRYSLLEEPSPADPNYRNLNNKWGITVDTHVSIQWRLKRDGWLIKNTSLGVGFSIFNIGQPFDTYYHWSHNSGFNPSYEYQANTLMYWGVHAFAERRLGERLFLKFMVMYSDGDWIKYTPFKEYSIFGNISLQYRIFGK